MIADLHGYFPKETITADMLLIGGDICPVWNHHISFEKEWLNNEFKGWLEKQEVKHIVFTPGNHDIIFEKNPELVPKLNWHCLIDKEIIIENLKIYGSPWQPIFYNWAFNLEEGELEKKWELIPNNIDILLLHGPPFNIMDSAPKGELFEHTGSVSLRKKILDIKPKCVIFGHIHGQYGKKVQKNIKFFNASLLNEQYKMVNKPIYIDI